MLNIQSAHCIAPNLCKNVSLAVLFGSNGNSYTICVHLANLCNENQLDALFILDLFRQTSSTCFGHVYCSSSGGIHCIYTAIDGFGGLVVSMLASGSRVRGFKPGRCRWIFTSVKILSMPSFGGEVKVSVPCPSFAACKRT
jgi:hypothetical protein